MKISSLSLLPYAPETKRRIQGNRAGIEQQPDRIQYHGTLAENARQSTARALRTTLPTRPIVQCAQCNGVGLSNHRRNPKKLLEENKLEADKLNEKLTEVQKLSAQIIALQRQKDEYQNMWTLHAKPSTLPTVLNELKTASSITSRSPPTKGEHTCHHGPRHSPHPLGWNTEWENSPSPLLTA